MWHWQCISVECIIHTVYYYYPWMAEHVLHDHQQLHCELKITKATALQNSQQRLTQINTDWHTRSQSQTETHSLSESVSEQVRLRISQILLMNNVNDVNRYDLSFTVRLPLIITVLNNNNYKKYKLLVIKQCTFIITHTQGGECCQNDTYCWEIYTLVYFQHPRRKRV